MKINLQIKQTCFVIFCLSLTETSFATRYHGNVTVGGYASTETFSVLTDGTSENDFATASSRFYLKVDEVSSSNLQVVADIRDKHDFFGKLDKQIKQLTDQNSLQVRQMSVRLPRPKGFYGTLGRFPVVEAGSVLTDGAEAGYHFSRSLGTALFGGLNAKLPEQTYAALNPDTQQYGLYLNYEPKDQPWTSYLYSNHAIVTQGVSNQIDRNYFYSNTMYQWAQDSRIFYLLYVDFVPRTFVQTASLSYQRKFGSYFDLELGALGYDTIEYRRLQNIREILTPSPYKEANVKLKQTVNQSFQLTERAQYGVRDVDSLSKFESAGGINLPKFLDKHLTSYFEGGYRNNFDRYGPFAKLGTGYYSRIWEFNFDFDYMIENQVTGVKHVTVAELSAGNFISKELFTTFSIQTATDEYVKIMSGFFKLTYRFGNEEISPLRDGASPVGRL